MDITIEPNKALIISGGQGSGKSRLARQVAKKFGPYVEVEGHELRGRGLDEVIGLGPQVVICAGLPTDPTTLHRIRAMIASPKVTINPKNLAPKTVAPPKFIFCCSSGFELKEADRRFTVVSVERRQEQSA